MSELDVNPAAEASQSAAPAPVLRPEHAEGVLAPVIEQQAAKIPVTDSCSVRSGQWGYH